ncbi:hypothetical protein HPG69_006855 [Diceros bicornis minor]|uniref:Uncharacterized protein n=1 Tax=Diceros bicornis minor TaxID=77932 RepID=A0A7J7ELC5_DICBM|nr:hypothetical protein HPG69_006855 [Diceros bicornis minor]
MSRDMSTSTAYMELSSLRCPVPSVAAGVGPRTAEALTYPVPHLCCLWILHHKKQLWLELDPPASREGAAMASRTQPCITVQDTEGLRTTRGRSGPTDHRDQTQEQVQRRVGKGFLRDQEFPLQALSCPQGQFMICSPDSNFSSSQCSQQTRKPLDNGLSGWDQPTLKMLIQDTYRSSGAESLSGTTDTFISTACMELRSLRSEDTAVPRACYIVRGHANRGLPLLIKTSPALSLQIWRLDQPQESQVFQFGDQD